MIQEETEAQGKKQMGSPPSSLEESIPNQESGFPWSPGSGLCHKRTLGGAGQKAGMGRGAQGAQNEGNSPAIVWVCLKGCCYPESVGGAQGAYRSRV